MNASEGADVAWYCTRCFSATQAGIWYHAFQVSRQFNHSINNGTTPMCASGCICVCVGVGVGVCLYFYPRKCVCIPNPALMAAAYWRVL
jgi:hypothetical protein